ncbi:MAG: hypothetical protein V4490_03120 [Pseudomonadota bacterium]
MYASDIYQSEQKTAAQLAAVLGVFEDAKADLQQAYSLCITVNNEINIRNELRDALRNAFLMHYGDPMQRLDLLDLQVVETTLELHTNDITLSSLRPYFDPSVPYWEVRSRLSFIEQCLKITMQQLLKHKSYLENREGMITRGLKVANQRYITLAQKLQNSMPSVESFPPSQHSEFCVQGAATSTSPVSCVLMRSRQPGVEAMSHVGWGMSGGEAAPDRANGDRRTRATP